MLSRAILKSNGTDQRVTEIETLKLKDLVKDVKKTENKKRCILLVDGAKKPLTIEERLKARKNLLKKRNEEKLGGKSG